MPRLVGTFRLRVCSLFFCRRVVLTARRSSAQEPPDQGISQGGVSHILDGPYASFVLAKHLGSWLLPSPGVAQSAEDFPDNPTRGLREPMEKRELFIALQCCKADELVRLTLATTEVFFISREVKLGLMPLITGKKNNIRSLLLSSLSERTLTVATVAENKKEETRWTHARIDRLSLELKVVASKVKHKLALPDAGYDDNRKVLFFKERIWVKKLGRLFLFPSRYAPLINRPGKFTTQTRIKASTRRSSQRGGWRESKARRSSSPTASSGSVEVRSFPLFPRLRHLTMPLLQSTVSPNLEGSSCGPSPLSSARDFL